MLKTWAAFTRREIHYMWRDKGLRYLLLAVPLLILLLFYATYHLQAMKGIPAAVVDLDNSSTSRQVVRMLEAAENLKIVAYPADYAELRALIEGGDAVVGAVIPARYGVDVAQKRQTKIYAAVDGSNLVYATNAVSALLTVTRTVSAEVGVKTLLGQGVAFNQAQDAVLGTDLREESWFNPALNYAYFLLLALVLNMWQQCCMLTSCMTVIGETDRRSWVHFKMSGLSRYGLFAAKAVTHITVFMLIVTPIYLIAFGLLKMPLHCGIFELLLFTLLFITAVHSIGTLMSSLARNAVDASRLGMATALPSFVVCGYTWPLEAMPPVLQAGVKILPQTWFFQGFNLLTFKNPGWAFMSAYFGALAVIALVCYGGAAVLTARK